MGNRNRNSASGFSLLEVMIAIAILAVSLLAIFNLQSTSLLGSARARRISVCTQLAREKMGRTLIELEDGIKKGEFPEEKEEGGTFEDEKFPDYSWKLNIKKVDIPAPPASEGQADIMAQVFSMVSQQLSQSTREVKLSVSWKEPETDEEEVGIVLTTHIVKM